MLKIGYLWNVVQSAFEVSFVVLNKLQCLQFICTIKRLVLKPKRFGSIHFLKNNQMIQKKIQHSFFSNLSNVLFLRHCHEFMLKILSNEISFVSWHAVSLTLN